MIVNWYLPTDSRDFNNMSASVWIRALQLFPYLEAFGVENRVNDTLGASDIVVFVRRQDPQSIECARKEKAHGAKVVFDLCVNYFDVSGAPGLADPVTQDHVDACMAMVELSDAVTCASANIAERASDFHENAHYIADSIDKSHFAHIKPETDFKRPKLRAVWSGVSSKAQELLPYMDSLRKFGIPLRIIAEKRPADFAPPLWFGRPKAAVTRWRYETFPDSIMSGEFVLAPRDVSFSYNMGHSFFKIGVFMAQGVPALGGHVPSYEELIGDGEGGKICTSSTAFCKEIARMVDDREYLVRQSRRAIEKLRPFETQAVSKQYLDLFSRLVGVGQPDFLQEVRYT